MREPTESKKKLALISTQPNVSKTAQRDKEGPSSIQVYNLSDLRSIGPVVSAILYENRSDPPTFMEMLIFWAIAQSVFMKIPTLDLSQPLQILGTEYGSIVRFANKNGENPSTIVIEGVDPDIVANKLQSLDMKMDLIRREVKINIEQKAAYVVLDRHMNANIEFNSLANADDAAEIGVENHDSVAVRRKHGVEMEGKTALPRPDLPRWAEQNRTKKPVKLRLPQHVIEAIDMDAESLGVDRNAWITMAIHKSLKL